MERYVIDVLKGLRPEKMAVKKFRNEKCFMFVREMSKKILVLNNTAREIYGACNGATVEEIIKMMSSRYPDIDMERITVDALMCLRDFERSGLIALR